MVYVDGVSRKFGSVVATVADIDEKNDDTKSVDSTVEVFVCIGYKPIIGASLSSIP